MMVGINYDKETLHELSNARSQVLYLYKYFPDTVQSDNLLFFKVLEVFYRIKPDFDNFRYVLEFVQRNKIKYETYSRTGRKLRNEFPERFERFGTGVRERVFRDFFGGFDESGI